MSPTARKEGYRGPLLFINRDVTNIGQRDPAETFSMNSHVASTYRYWFRNEKIQGAPADNFTNIAPPTKDHRQGRREQSDHFAAKIASSHRPPILGSSRSPANTSIANASTTQFKSSQLVRRMNSELRTIIGRGNSDPFNAAALTMTPLHIELIQNWERRYYYYSNPLGASEGARRLSVLTWQQQVNDSIGNEMVLHAIFAGALIFLHYHPQMSTADIQRRSLFHQGKCLQLIRRSTKSSEISPDILLAIAFVSVIHFFRRDFSAALVHVQAMKRFTDSLGGLSSLPSGLGAKLWLSELEVADSCLQKMAFNVSEWDVQDWKYQYQFSTYRARFEVLQSHMMFRHHSELPGRLKELLDRHRETIIVQRLAMEVANNDVPTADAIFHWLQIRKYALRASTLDLFHNIKDQCKSNSIHSQEQLIKVDIEACLCLAINYCQRLIFDPRYENVMCIPIQHLQSILAIVLQHVASRGHIPRTTTAFCGWFSLALAWRAYYRPQLLPRRDGSPFNLRF